MKHDLGHRLALGLAATLLYWGTPALADSYDGETAPRTLGRLQFVPSSLVTWGFVDSEFAITSSGAYISYGVGPRDVAARSTTGSRNVTLLGVAQTVSGSAALAPWLGVAGRLTGASDIPRGLTAVALVGVHVSFGVEGDLFVRLIRSGPFQLTARGDFGYNQNRDVLPEFLSDRVVIGHVTTIRPAVTAALAVSPQLGFQASGSYGWQWFDINQSGLTETLELAAAAVISLHPIPITLLAGAGGGRATGDSPDTFGAQALYGSGGTWGRAEGGVFYTGRRDLDLGLSATYQFSDTDGDRRWVGNFRLGYYF